MKNRKTDWLMSKRLRMAAALTAVMLLGVGCGQQAYNEDGGEDGNYNGPNYNYPSGNGSGNNGGGSNGSVVITDPTTIGGNTPPSYSWQFKTKGSGYATVMGGGSMKVFADTKLQIAVSAGGGLQLSNSGFTIGFNCEKFTIKVGNVTRTAFVRKAGYTPYGSYDPCNGAVETWTGDFSGALGNGQDQERTIQIFGAMYDNCHQYGSTYIGGCNLHSVYSTHEIDGFIDVYTN